MNTPKSSKNNRIQDLQQINYVKKILEAAINQCQQAGMHDPNVYLGTAQRIADGNSLNDPHKPRITFNTKSLKVREQENPVSELTATIGEQTSTSYFLMKDSAPPGVKPTQEELTFFRPDVVSTRIQASLGFTQPTPVATTPVPATAVNTPQPTQTNPPASKAQALFQAMSQPAVVPNSTTDPPAPLQNQPQVANQLVDGLAALANGVAPPIPNQNPTEPQVSNQTTSSVLPNPAIEPTHNPVPAPTMKVNMAALQTVGNFKVALGQALKNMSKGQINPVQLYGDLMLIMGNFINGIPKGVHEARLQSIATKMNQAEREKAAINRLVKQTGEKIMDWGLESQPQPVPTEVKTKVAVTAPQSEPESEVREPLFTKTAALSEPTAIDKLLKSNLPIEQKLDAIEQTLDKMLEELIEMRKTLEATQALVQADIESSKSQIESVANPNHVPIEDTIIETEVETEVAVLANQLGAEVPVRTEIDTDIVAEVKTATEAAKDIEVPEVEVDSTPEEDVNIAHELAETISSYQGDINKLNKYLKLDQLQIEIAEDGSTLMIKELEGSVASTVFTAEANGEGWNIDSRINDSVQLDVLSSFVQAEQTALADREPEIKPQPS
ncbi:MAG: hypothetical protein RLZZ69_212, partial [Cyanobacteriota bacterium]